MIQHIQINAKIEALSGLRIGGNKDTMQIGGIDSPIIKNPITNMPYLPGSSLKGKVRFLLEHHLGLVIPEDGGNIPKLKVKGRENKIAIIFGHLEHAKNLTYPTRVVFRDSNIIGAVVDGELNTDLTMLKDRMASDFSEAKTEGVINRLSGAAKDGGLRTTERVPAGTVFDFSLSLRIYKDDEADEYKGIILKGLKLLQQDALGGSGSRGYGRIKFFDLTVDDVSLDLEKDITL